jgi:hypothetical protein
MDLNQAIDLYVSIDLTLQTLSKNFPTTACILLPMTLKRLPDPARIGNGADGKFQPKPKTQTGVRKRSFVILC